MGSCVSKSGEAQGDADNVPYERGSKKRKSWRKSKKVQKQQSVEAEVQQNDTEPQEIVTETEEPTKLRNSLYDNEGEDVDSNANQNERPVPMPRARSKENLVGGTYCRCTQNSLLSLTMCPTEFVKAFVMMMNDDLNNGRGDC